MPAFIWNNLDIFIYSIIAAIISIIFVRIYARKKQENEGKQTPVLYISIGLLLILPLLSFLIGGASFSLKFLF